MSAFAHFFDEIAAGIPVPGAKEAARAELAARYARLGLREVDPPFPLPTATLVGDISPAIAHTITSFFARRPAWGVCWDDNPPVVLCRATVGSGKSQRLADYLPHLVYWDKHVAKRPHRVIVLAPTLELAHQLAGRYRRVIRRLVNSGKLGAGLTVAVFEGRGDPFDEAEPPRRDYPCADLPSVKLAIQAGDTVQSAVCGNKKDSEPRCPHRGNCKYYRQMGAAADADILFIAHPFVYEDLPEMLCENVSAVIVEEDPFGLGRATVTLDADTFTPRLLARHPVLHGAKAKQAFRPNERDTAKLATLFAALDHFRSLLEEGRHPNEAVIEAGITKADCEAARKLSNRRRVPTGMFPGMSYARRYERKNACSYNTVLKLIAVFLHALEEIAPEELNRVSLPDERDMSPPRLWTDRGQIIIPGLKLIAEWLANRPILIMSATARPELAAKYFEPIGRRLEVITAPEPALPHQHVHLVLGAFGKRAAANKSRDLVDYTKLLAFDGSDTLVITHKQIEELFQGEEPHISTLHHGNVEGFDDFAHVRRVVVIGGPCPDPGINANHKLGNLAEMASAECRHQVLPAPPVRMPVAVTLGDGTGCEFEGWGFAEPATQAVFENVYLNGILQAIGRGRGIQRTENNPLDVYLLANAALPLAVDEVTRWREVKPDWVDRMALAGVMLTNAQAMVDFGIFQTTRAADQALWRAGGAQTIRERAEAHYNRLDEPSHIVRYQPAGQGYHARQDYVRASQLKQHMAEIRRQYRLAGDLIVTEFTPGRQLSAPPPVRKEDFDKHWKNFQEALSKSSALRDWPPGGGNPSTVDHGARPPPDG